MSVPDWKKIVNDLEAEGLKQHEIAKRAGCSQPLISMIARGGLKGDPAWPVGNGLIRLHRIKCGKRPA